MRWLSVLTSRSLEVTRSIIALGNEDIVLTAVAKRLVQGDGGTHEHLLDFAETLETGLELDVVVCLGLSDCRHDGDVVALGTDVVGVRDDGDVDVCNENPLVSAIFTNLPPKVEKEEEREKLTNHACVQPETEE